MSKKVKYYSTDKLYIMKKKKIRKELLYIFIIILFLGITMISFVNYNASMQEDKKSQKMGYKEDGNIDYKVYLKENDYYENSFLDKGMQYVASLINTVSVNFDYKIETEEEIDYTYEYSIKANLKIMNQNDKNKVLYHSEEILLKDMVIEKEDKDIEINKDIDIDYNKYNDYVNAFKKDYGLIVDSSLELVMEIEVKGEKEKSNLFHKTRTLKTEIPLSEQTINIDINTDEIEKEGSIKLDHEFSEETKKSFMITVIFGLITIILIIYVLIKYNKKDGYQTKLNKILKEYDRIIVEGKLSIEESKYKNKIIANDFSELVDASEVLNEPILYYNVIPGHKSYFVIIHKDTLYKYRLTRAKQNKEEEK